MRPAPTMISAIPTMRDSILPCDVPVIMRPIKVSIPPISIPMRYFPALKIESSKDIQY